MRNRHWCVRVAWGTCLAVALAAAAACQGCRSDAEESGLAQERAALEVTSPAGGQRAGTGGHESPRWGPEVALSDTHEVKLVALGLASVTPRTAALSVELRRRDGEPIPSDVTFDTAVTDNRFVEYNVPCTYRGLGARGEDVSIWEGPRSIRQDLSTGPLHERVRWLRIKVTIYARDPIPGQADAFELTALEVLDLGNHPVESAPSTGPVRWASLVGRRVPVYPGADGVEVHDQKGARWGTLSYVVPALPYPSRDVADFYSEWALDNDWLPVEPSTRSWQQFIDATQRSEVTVCQLWLEWREKKSGDRLVVICEYRLGKEIVRGEYPTDSARDQTVHVGVYPAESVGEE